ncbi:unnamed protein product [Nippostrongylus brasiliensis]|uniref:Synaptojanin-2-like n=1 Tax=Nippostrongylus brasiliensis TaxID=27835 RepID=A0A0N4Y334_NIPBR|nr:unnamed protein product [Nippostrongylus brasiliensis]
MDGVQIDGYKLSVRLRSPEWTESLQPKLTRFSQSLSSSDSISECDVTITNGDEFEFDDNDDDMVSERSSADSGIGGAEEFASRCVVTPLQSAPSEGVRMPIRQAPPPPPALPSRPQIPVVPPRPKGFNVRET